MTDDWATFVEKLRGLLNRPLAGIENGQPTRLTYTDDEGDVIVVRSTHELVEAYRCQNGVKKFNVTHAECPHTTWSLDTTEVTLPEVVPSSPLAECTAMHQVAAPSCPISVVQDKQHSDGERPASAPKVKFNKMTPNQKLLHFLRLGRLKQADRFFCKHDEKGTVNNDFVFLYNGACLYARMNRLHYSAKLLERSVLAGFRDLTNMMLDTDLVEVRRIPEYETVVQLLRAMTAETPRPAVVPLDDNDDVTVVPTTPVTPQTPAPTTPTFDSIQKPTAPDLELVAPDISSEIYAHQSTLNTLVAMGIADTQLLRQIITEEKGVIANVIDRILM